MFSFFSISDSLGGAEQLIMKLAKAKKGDVEICFFKKKSTNAWIEEGFNVIYCNGNIFKVIRFCRSRKFNMIFSSHLMMNAFLGFLRSLNILKTNNLVCRESTSVFSRYKGGKLLKYKLAYFIGYRKIDLLITQTSTMRKALINNLPYLEKRIKIATIPNLFEFPKEKIVIKDYEFPYIVSAGRLIWEKGFDILIEAFSIFKKEYKDYKLIILGEGKDRSKLEVLIKDLDLIGEVILLGFVDDVYTYFKSASLCVVSSRLEGFPNVLLQMMSQNSKVVSTLCAGDIDTIPNLVTVKANNVEDLTRGLFEGINSNMGEENLYDKYLEQRNVYNYYNQVFNFLKK